MKKVIALFLLWFLGIRAYSQVFHWAESFGGSGQEKIASIKTDSKGNIYTTGAFSGTVDFDPGPGIYELKSAGETDIFILKLDAHGDFVWAERIGGANKDEATSLCLDSKENILISGNYSGSVDFNPGINVCTLNSDYGFFIVKLTAAGSFNWAIDLDGQCYINSIATDMYGNVYAAGNFYLTIDFDPGPGVYSIDSKNGGDLFILKLNPSGKFLWTRQMGGLGKDVISSIKIGPTGNIYTTGWFEENADFDPGAWDHILKAKSDDAFISKLNADGHFIWAKSIGGINIERGYDITVDISDNICVTGLFYGDVDFDPDSGNYILSSLYPLSDNAFILKLNSNGNFIWAKQISAFIAYGKSITLDDAGNIYSIGEFEGSSIDLDPGTGVFPINPQGNLDIYISKLNPSGDFVWGQSISGQGQEKANSIHIDKLGNIYVNGTFISMIDCDPGDSTYNLTGNGNTDIFIIKEGPDSIDFDGNATLNENTMFPNPTHEELRIERCSKCYPYYYKITDATGRLILDGRVNDKYEAVNVSSLSSGVYYLQLDLTKSRYIKFVKR
jgi:hypothetical protein